MPRTERLKRRAASRASAEEAAAAQAERKKSKSWNESRFTLGQQMDQARCPPPPSLAPDQSLIENSHLQRAHAPRTPRRAQCFVPPPLSVKVLRCA